MASPVVEQVVENSTSTAGTDHTINLPTATAGQLLLIVLDKGSTAATVNAHASLTELLDENSANGLYIAYREMDGTEPASYTLVTSASTRTASFAYRISGAAVPATQPPVIGTTASGSASAPDPPASATPSGTKDFLVITFYGSSGEEADDDTWSDASPTNYTPSPPRMKACGIAGSQLGGLIAAAERAVNLSAAENPGTFTKDVTLGISWRAQTILIYPAEGAVTATPGTATLTFTRNAPTVTASDHKIATPGTANLTFTRNTPSVTVGVRVTPGTATLTLSPQTPTVSVSDNKLVIPGTLSLTLTRNAPTVSVSDNKTVTPGTASLTFTRNTPTVTASDHKTATPGTATLTFTRFAPTVTVAAGLTVTPGTATLTLTRFAPTVTATADLIVVPGAAALVLTRFAPIVTATQDEEEAPPAPGPAPVGGLAFDNLRKKAILLQKKRKRLKQRMLLLR